MLAFDVDDKKRAHALARAIGWDEKMKNLDEQLFALYTVARKPKE